MKRYVALLRGVNIGAKKRIRMVDRRALIESLGYKEVKTYVNSGNAVFTSSAACDNATLAKRIGEALSAEHGLDVPVVVRSGGEVALIVANNPFPEHAANHKTLHVSFLSEEPSADLVDALSSMDRGEDEYRVFGENVYLHYPNGISGAVFMVNGLDKALKVDSTSRNWRTLVALAEMAGE
ncbi:DUF1697 domain-containing protein [soil metagenome]